MKDLLIIASIVLAPFVVIVAFVFAVPPFNYYSHQWEQRWSIEECKS